MTDIKFDIIARDKASSTFRGVGKAADSSGSHLAKFAHYAKLATVGLAGFTATAAVFTYKVGSDYVNSLNQIQALTGKNDKAMKAAAKTLESNSALYAKMGQTTGDAASGVVELTKAGLSLHDSLKAVNATMVLAKAGQLSVADASTLVANSLNTFGLKAKAAGKLANTLANAANISSADVTDLAESFKYVSPVAAAAGVSIQQTSAILAELSNSGIKASSAGTALRTFLLNLQAPAAAGAAALSDLNIQVFDAAGNMKPLPDVIGQLSGALNGLPAKEKAADLKAIFGKVGIAGATAILNGGKKGLLDYTKGVEKAGAASKLAQAKSKGLAGTIATLKAQVISAAQKIYREYSPALNKRLKEFVQQFKDGTGAGGKFHDALKNVASIAKTLWPAMQKTAQYTGDFLGYLASHKTELKLFVGAMLALKGASMAKSSGLFSLGKSALGRSVGSTVTGGIQKVYVVNMGPGGGGVLGGAGKGATTAENAAGATGFWAAARTAIARFAPGLVTAGDIGHENPHTAKDSAGNTVNLTIRGPGGVQGKAAFLAATGGIKKMADATDALNARTAAASRSLDMVGPHAAASAKKGEAAIAAWNASRAGGLAAVKGAAALAAGALDAIGGHAQSSASSARAAVAALNSAIQGIKDRKVKVSADTGQAMGAVSSLRYQIDQLHNKTIIVRVTGGHVPGDPTSGGGGGAGGSGSGGSGAGRGFSRAGGQAAGRDYMSGLIDGIAGKRISVENAISRIADAISGAKSKLSNLKGIRSGFRNTFGADSIFGQDFSSTKTISNVATINGVAVRQGDDITKTSPGSIADVLKFQRQQRNKARSLNADVKKVTSMGLSKALIAQLQSQGAAGAATLHTLAQGTPQQIRELNALNKQTSNALASAGMRAGDYRRGGSVAADIRSAKKTEHVLELLEHHLKDLAHSERKGQTIVVQIDSEAVIRAIVRRNKRKGVKTAGL